METRYVFSFKDKVQATTFYEVAKINYLNVAYVGDYSTVAFSVNMPAKNMAKHIKALKQGNFGISKVKAVPVA
jgi:hypothetical protein